MAKPRYEESGQASPDHQKEVEMAMGQQCSLYLGVSRLGQGLGIRIHASGMVLLVFFRRSKASQRPDVHLEYQSPLRLECECEMRYRCMRCFLF